MRQGLRRWGIVLILFLTMGLSRYESAWPAAVREGLGWSAGKIQVTGIGIPPDSAASETVRREMARRSALADGERKLVKALAEIKGSPDRGLQSGADAKQFTKMIHGFIRGYRVTGERERKDGTIEIDLELPLDGRGGLSRHPGP